MNPLPWARLHREVLALARQVYGWGIRMEFKLALAGRLDRFGRPLHDAKVWVGLGDAVILDTPWMNSVSDDRKTRPPKERALRDMRTTLRELVGEQPGERVAWTSGRPRGRARETRRKEKRNRKLELMKRL